MSLSGARTVELIISRDKPIEEGRAASKILIKNVLSMSQQAVSADIIPNLSAAIFP
jgi:hypothetical protein